MLRLFRLRVPINRICQICSSKRNLSSEALQTCRNLGIIAHIDAGKTTTSEQMLFLCGETKSVGRVDTGDTVMDFLPQERERGITIQAAAITLNWKSHRINLIDTPGHVDFTIEVERSVRVIDGAVIIVDAVSGVQAQTKTVWRQAQKQSLPAIAFVNKMDRDGASFDHAIESIKTKLGANVVPLQMPVFDSVGGSFVGIIDLLTLSKTAWGDDWGTNGQLAATSGRVPLRAVINQLSEDDPLYPSAARARKELIERIVETSDPLMDQYLERGEESITLDALLDGIRAACLSCAIVPALCGASLRGKGVESLLDSVLAFLPSPLDKPSVPAHHKSDPSKVKHISAKNTQDLCALAFKVVHDAARGPLVFVRTFSGTLSSKQTLYNSSTGAKERINQLLAVTADDLAPLAELGPGNVGCLVGLKDTTTGDTLVADKGPLRDHVLTGLTVPKPVFSLSIEPEQSSQQTELETALAILCTEDPSLQVTLDKESGQTLLRGIGELHLEIVCDKLKRQFNVEVATGRAYVAYRESLAIDEAEGDSIETSILPGRKAISHQYIYDKTVGTKRLFAGMVVHFTPLDSAEDSIVVVDKAKTPALTNEERVSLIEGINGSLSRGPKGFPVVGLHVSVEQVEKDADTTPGSIRACCAMLVDQVLKSSRHVLLEPVMDLEVDLPTEFVGDVLSDLTVKRRAVVKEVVMGRDGSSQGGLGGQTNALILARVPLSTMLGYATSIRSMTQGEGSFAMEFGSMELVDESAAQL